MSTGARAARTEPVAAGVADGVGRTADPGDRPGRLLGRLSVLPALVATAWLLAGLPLLLAGRFTPTLMLVIWVPLTIMLVVFGLRWIPDRWQGALPARKPEQARTPWWALAGVVAVAVGFGVDQLIYHSQFIIVTHSKKTMATADVLYGITMQESGISKQVTIRFEDWVEESAEPKAQAS